VGAIERLHTVRFGGDSTEGIVMSSIYRAALPEGGYHGGIAQVDFKGRCSSSHYGSATLLLVQ